jgi:predicted aspartyl protease
VAMLLSCSTPEYVNSFVIDTSCDLSIVDGELNGRKTFFLLDTGAGLTTFDLNQGKKFGFTSADTDELIGGFTNDKTNAKMAIGISSIKINGIEIHDGTVYANKMDNLVQFICGCSHKTISGIIGAPLIKKYGLVIDLTNGRLIKVN